MLLILYKIYLRSILNFIFQMYDFLKVNNISIEYLSFMLQIL